MNIELPSFSNEAPFVLIGGMNVIESQHLLETVCHHLKIVCSEMDIPFVFKASIDKANRSSISSYRGLGIQKGIDLLLQVKERFQIPIITDIHEPWQAKPISEVADILQIPAFLCRQTDLLQAACETQNMLLIKKMQMMSPLEMKNIIQKCQT